VAMFGYVWLLEHDQYCMIINHLHVLNL